jgi:hypothetical protein
MPFPFAAPHPVGERRHLVEHSADIRHDVLAADEDRRASGRAQRHVQDRTILGDVDLVAAEHRVDAVAQPARFGQRKQQAQRFIGDAILGIVEKDAGRLGSEPVAPTRIRLEQIA